MRYSPMRFLQFADHTIRADFVLKKMTVEGAESYREYLEELLETYADRLPLYACWREIPVKVVEEDRVTLCSRTMEDAYLAARLSGIRTIKVFLAGIGDDMWNTSLELKDPLERYLFQQVMNAAFHLAFREVCVDMTRSMPKGAKLFMDNPGIDGGWDLKHQDALMELLFFEEQERRTQCPTNPFQFSGIVYTSNTADSTRKNIRYMTGEQLVSILYQTAGILPMEDIE